MHRSPWLKGLALALGGLLTATAIATSALSLGTLEACQTFEVGEGTSQVAADQLLAQGWYGDPTDGAERLYAPSCRA